MAGSCSALLMPALSRSMMGCGVPRGAIVPNQSTTSYPGSVSASVGTLGSVCQRLAVVTASALNLPVGRCGVTGSRLPTITGTCPDKEIGHRSAGALVLNGDHLDLRHAREKLGGEMRGAAGAGRRHSSGRPFVVRASAISSLVVFAGSDGCTVSTNGV